MENVGAARICWNHGEFGQLEKTDVDRSSVTCPRTFLVPSSEVAESARPRIGNQIAHKHMIVVDPATSSCVSSKLKLAAKLTIPGM
jgi:hypothetical protein